MTIVRDKSFWDQYLNERTGTYEFRTRRYAAVLDKLMLMGFSTYDSLTDVGAGRQEFERFLREQGWEGRYIAVDGSIDGTDLDLWTPSIFCDWMVAIEVIEHLYRPKRLVSMMQGYAIKGFAITTPNPEVVDVLAIDRTHVSIITPDSLDEWGLRWERATLFASDEHRQDNDSLIGWWRR